MAHIGIKDSGLEFIAYLDGWLGALPDASLADLASRPETVAIASIDVINGFCHQGPLASDRVRMIIEPITRLMKAAWQSGVRHFLLIQDTHDPDAVEFGQFPPHCVRGSVESQTVPEIQALPFYREMQVIEKNSIHPAMDTGLPVWCATHREVSIFLVVGDCTDLCTYQLAMHLRLEANARQLHRRVIVPVEGVDTYDLSVEAATAVGALPHPASLLHPIFLYSMALNGVEIVRRVN